MGNAERFVRHHGRNVRYCHAREQWFRWNSQYWQVDEKDEVIQLAQDTMRLFHDQAYREDAFNKVQDEQARTKKSRTPSRGPSRVRPCESSGKPWIWRNPILQSPSWPVI
jgi:putative DNA primase/helicase